MNQKKYILIVDDEQDVLQIMLKTIISRCRMKYQPLVCVDGFEALEFMIDKKIDLVVLDLNMDNFNGLQVCQRMMQDPELKSIPVIISSGHLDPSMVEQLQSLGVKYFLKKPYPMNDLVEKIEEVIG